jgi:hypothetical protein
VRAIDDFLPKPWALDDPIRIADRVEARWSGTRSGLAPIQRDANRPASAVA